VAGILGILGEASLDELGAMAAHMAYRGSKLSASNPAPSVYLGEIHHVAGGGDRDSALCLDTNGALYLRNPGGEKSSASADDGDRKRLEQELRQRGVVALRDVSGHFALAFWDAATRTTTLACDRQGFKTLYYVELPGRIAFASDYKALLALPDCPAELDRDALQTYLVLFSCPPGRSLLKGVKPLAQAAVLNVRDGHASVDRFWTPQRRHPERSFAESARALRATLETAFTGQLAGYERAGLLLSGGFDSAALLGLVRRVRPDLEVSTYTVGHSAGDPDILGARNVAAHFGTEHHEHFYSLKDLPADLPRMVWQTEDLSGREEALLQPAITAVAARRERMILAGHGADAVFGGMPRHRILWMRDRAPPPLRGALCELYVYTRYKRMPRSWLGRQLVARAYRGDLPEPPRVIDANPVGAGEGCKSLDRYLEEHISPSSGFLHDEPVLAEVGMTMLMPFLDPAVTEFALGCPGSYHIGLREQKRLLRAAVADLLPPAMLASRKTIQRLKHDRVLSNAIDGIAKELDLARSLTDRKLIVGDYVWSLGVRSSDGTISPERMHTLWGLICAELWMRQFIDRRGRPIDSLDAQAR
jgi:asparagine synthase (glutamine-hydrolysing)